MVFDDHFHHNHYYPARGYAVPGLPLGLLTVPFRGSPLFFHSGVWYQRTGPGYVVVQPPFGIAIPVLPPGYATVWAGGMPYYYTNDIYYTQAPGEYMVADPPMNISPIPGQAPPPPTVDPQAGPAPESTSTANWSYCESAKAYYPYIKDCKVGWREVPATPPTPR